MTTYNEPKNIENNIETKPEGVVSENQSEKTSENIVSNNCEYDDWHSDSSVL